MSRTKSLILLPLFAAMISVILASAAFADVSRFTQVESFTESSADISTTYDAGANPDDGVSNNTMRFVAPSTPQFASKTTTFSGTSNTDQIEIRARGVNTDGTMPNVRVYVDGTATGNSIVNRAVSSGYSNITASIPAISPGSHTINVRIANDQAGDKIFVDFLRFYTSDPLPDTTPPQTTITVGQYDGGYTWPGQVNYNFESSEANSTFECKVEGPEQSGLWAACEDEINGTPGFTFFAWEDGQYQFSVRAIDASSNVDPTPASRMIQVDTVPPGEFEISSGPSSTISVDEAEFEFTESEGATRYACELRGVNGNTYHIPTDDHCESPKSYENLPDGDYSFWVTAWKDLPGIPTENDPWLFTVDTTP